MDEIKKCEYCGEALVAEVMSKVHVFDDDNIPWKKHSDKHFLFCLNCQVVEDSYKPLAELSKEKKRKQLAAIKEDELTIGEHCFKCRQRLEHVSLTTTTQDELNRIKKTGEWPKDTIGTWRSISYCPNCHGQPYLKLVDTKPMDPIKNCEKCDSELSVGVLCREIQTGRMGCHGPVSATIYSFYDHALHCSQCQAVKVANGTPEVNTAKRELIDGYWVWNYGTDEEDWPENPCDDCGDEVHYIFVTSLSQTQWHRLKRVMRDADGAGNNGWLYSDALYDVDLSNEFLERDADYIACPSCYGIPYLKVIIRVAP